MHDLRALPSLHDHVRRRTLPRILLAQFVINDVSVALSCTFHPHLSCSKARVLSNSTGLIV